MPSNKSNPSAGFFMLGMFLGAAVGAAIGLLYAPQPGADARHELADWAEQQAARARSASERLEAEIDEAVESAETAEPEAEL